LLLINAFLLFRIFFWFFFQKKMSGKVCMSDVAVAAESAGNLIRQ